MTKAHAVWVGTFAFAASLASCRQENDRPAIVPPPGAIVLGNRQIELQPGLGQAFPENLVKNPFESDDEAIADGKRIYMQFNCYGCHAAGGGGMGPALMDDEWIYGSSPGNIFWSIIEGRPQGMPAFGGRVVEDQVWRMVAYIRSLSGLHKHESTRAPQRSNGGRKQ